MTAGWYRIYIYPVQRKVGLRNKSYSNSKVTSSDVLTQIDQMLLVAKAENGQYCRIQMSVKVNAKIITPEAMRQVELAPLLYVTPFTIPV